MPLHEASCFLNKGQFAHIGVFNRNRILLAQGQFQLYFKVSVTDPSDVVNAGWLYRPRDIDLSFRASLRSQFALWLVAIELSPVFLLELGKAVAAGKKKKTLAASKANATSASVLERWSGFRSEALNSHESLQLPVGKRKAEEFSSSDSSSEPANHRPAPGHLFGDGPTSQGSTGETATQTCQVWAGMCCGGSWPRWSAKWAAQTPSQGFGPL